MEKPLKEKYKGNLIIFLIKILILAYCCFLIYENLENETILVNLISQIDIDYLLIIFFFTVLLIHLQIFTTFKTINLRLNNRLDFIFFLKLIFNSQLMSLILPHSGLIYRAYKLKKYNLSYTDFIGISYFIAWFYFYLFIIFYSFEILIFGGTFDNFRYIIFIIGLIVSLSIYLLPFVFNKFFTINFKNALIYKLYHKLRYIFLFPLEFKKKKIFYFLYSYGIISHLLAFIIIYLITKSLNIEISFNQIVILFVINSFLDQVPITPKNIGIGELVFGIMATNLGLNFEIGLGIKLLLRLYYFFNLIFFSVIYNFLVQSKK